MHDFKNPNFSKSATSKDFPAERQLRKAVTPLSCGISVAGNNGSEFRIVFPLPVIGNKILMMKNYANIWILYHINPHTWVVVVPANWGVRGKSFNRYAIQVSQTTILTLIWRISFKEICRYVSRNVYSLRKELWNFRSFTNHLLRVLTRNCFIKNEVNFVTLKSFSLRV